MRRTPLHCFASHLPSWFVSYFDFFISAVAWATLPWSPGVLNGWKPVSWLLNSVSGTMWLAIVPAVGPPHAFRSASLSATQFIALRTWMSSKGAWVRFIVMYHVRSPELMWKFFRRLGFVTYSRMTFGEGCAPASSWSSPALILLKMSSLFVSTRKSNSSGKLSRAALVSVFGL